MKQCNKCGKEKPLSEFKKDGRKKSGRGGRCKECENEYNNQYKASHPEKRKEWQSSSPDYQRKRYAANPEKFRTQKRNWGAANPEKQRNISLKYRYGIDALEHEAMLKEQSGLCGICGGDNNGKALDIDHYHETNEVRGLLCGACNKALGFIRDDPVVALRMADYLNGEYRLKKLFGIPVEFPATRLSKLELT